MEGVPGNGGSPRSSPDEVESGWTPHFEHGPGPDVRVEERESFPWSVRASASAESPAESSAAAAKKDRARVRFNSNAATTAPPAGSLNSPKPVPEQLAPPPAIARPSVLRGSSSNSIPTTKDFIHEFDPSGEKETSAARAQERAKQVAARVHHEQDVPRPVSRGSVGSGAETFTSEGSQLMSEHDIPLEELTQHGESHKILQGDESHNETSWKYRAYDLVQAHTRPFRDQHHHNASNGNEAPSSQPIIPDEINDGNYDGVYGVPPPQQYRGSVLSQLLKLYKPAELGQSQTSKVSLPGSLGGQSTLVGTSTSAGTSGATTPVKGSVTPKKKWYQQNKSQETLANLVEASTRLAAPAVPIDGQDDNKANGKGAGQHSGKNHGKKRSGHKRSASNNRLSSLWQKEEVRITVHIAETLARQEYIIKLCRALMLFGAPTHRLEEYLSMTARVLEIDGQFLYLPGCMIISFDDRSTHTTEVRIVRLAQGIDLGKLKDVHLIYKEVMHDVIGVEEGTLKLDDLVKAKDKFHPWFRVLIFGLTSATCAPFSFSARLIDLPIIFFFGCLVGMLQLIVAPKSALYSNVFEVTSTVIVSFLARAFGSISNGNLFCFSALAQSGIVMLLPGYAVLCSSLELQSRAIVPGSIRIVYAIVYSLLIGFGITVGSALYALFDSNATSSIECQDPIPAFWGFAFVPLFVLCISILYQAKWRQMPVMVVIAFAGYVVNYFSGRRFSSTPQISSALGALTVGVLANIYSRLRHGVAAATLIPAIFTQVPGGLASNGGLLSGLEAADMLTEGTSSGQNSGSDFNSVIFNVAARMITIATGIAVGLFISALIIYPLGKRRSGLFSF